MISEKKTIKTSEKFEKKNNLKKKDSVKKESEKLITAPITENYVLKLFVAGNTANSLIAVKNTKAICEKYLKGRYKLEVIDIYQQPLLVMEEQILAVPTLIKKMPSPIRKLIGNSTNIEKVLVALNIKN